MKLKTRYYKPHPTLLKIPEDERIQWAEWLETTEMEQCQGQMTVGPNTACCLHVWECYKQNNGKWFDTDTDVPSNMKKIKPTPIIDDKLPENIKLAIKTNLNSTDIIFPAQLNDDEYFTFNEIAQILRGNTVTIDEYE